MNAKKALQYKNINYYINNSSIMKTVVRWLVSIQEINNDERDLGVRGCKLWIIIFVVLKEKYKASK
jgi:hypothetical protein